MGASKSSQTFMHVINCPTSAFEASFWGGFDTSVVATKS